ncbi:MAG: cation:dicarboxylate symporter family transporter, partial [Pseudomonas helleri]
MHKPRIPLVAQILIGLITGIAVGAILNYYPDARPWLTTNVLQPAGDLFNKMMK